MKSAGYFTAYLIIGILAYIPSLFNGFMSDDFVWLELLRIGPGEYYNFGDRFFLPLSHYIQYSMLFFVGENPNALHFFQLIIHVINAYILFQILKIWNPANDAKAQKVAFFGGLLFLLFPYNTEAVNWFAAMSYPLSVLFLLLSACAFNKALSSHGMKYVFVFAILLLMSFLCKEISITAILIPIGGLLWGIIPKSKQTTRIILSGLLALVVYFILRKLLLGSFIGGYGVEVHTQFSIVGMIKTFIIYFAKFFLVYRYLFADWHSLLWLKVFIISATVILIGIVTIYVLLKDRKPKLLTLRLFGFLFTVFIVLCLPVVNLETTSLSDIQSDRYGYLPSLAAIIISLFVVFRLKKQIAFSIALTVSAFFLILTIQTNIVYRQNNQVISNIIEDFGRNHQPGNSVVILSIPDNYGGVYTFRHGFIQAVHRENRWLSDQIEIIAWQNTNSQTILECYCNPLEIQVQSKNNPFVKINEESRFVCVDAAKDYTSFSIDLVSSENIEYMYFNRGHLHLIACGAKATDKTQPTE